MGRPLILSFEVVVFLLALYKGIVEWKNGVLRHSRLIQIMVRDSLAYFFTYVPASVGLGAVLLSTQCLGPGRRELHFVVVCQGAYCLCRTTMLSRYEDTHIPVPSRQWRM